MAKINLTQLGSIQGMDNDQAIRRIESYLFTLNEQLRYELTHIDEDNMAVNNTPARQVSASSGESSGSTQVDGQTIDLNDNLLIRQLKARLAELQTSQKQAVAAINNNTQSITDALKEINNVKNRTWSYPSHRHSLQIDGSGNLTMGGPTVNPTYPNIAATAYVQGLVAAARTAGYNEGRRDWRPDNIRISGKNVIVLNAAGDDVGGPYSAAEIYNAGWVDGYNAAAGVSGKSVDTVTVPTTTSSQGVTPTVAYTAHAQVNDTHYISFPPSISLVPGQVFQGAAGNYVYKNSVELRGSASGAVYWD